MKDQSKGKSDEAGITDARKRIKDAIKNLKDARSNPLGPIPDVSAEKALAAQYGLSDELNGLEKALAEVIKAQEEKIAAAAAAAASSSKSVAEDLKNFNEKLATDPVGAMRDYLNDETVKKNRETLKDILDGKEIKGEEALNKFKALGDQVTSETDRYKRKALIEVSLSIAEQLDEKNKNSSTPLSEEEYKRRKEVKAGLSEIVDSSIHDVVLTKDQKTLNKSHRDFNEEEANKTAGKTKEAKEALDKHLGEPEKIAKLFDREQKAVEKFIHGPKDEPQITRLKAVSEVAEMLVKRSEAEKMRATLENAAMKNERKTEVVEKVVVTENKDLNRDDKIGGRKKSSVKLAETVKKNALKSDELIQNLPKNNSKQQETRTH
jgi:hypothetical protein